MTAAEIDHDQDNASIEARLLSLRRQISDASVAVGRDPLGVRLVAVSKMIPLDRIQLAIDAGHRLFGENYVQEAKQKITLLRERSPELIDFHFIGRLQRNKVRSVTGLFSLIHSIDRIELAIEVDRESGKAGVVQNILLQVNVSEQESKGGFDTGEIEAAVSSLIVRANLKISGLMCIGSPDIVQAEKEFQTMASIQDRLQLRFGVEFPELSMGMSSDFCEAIRYGATLVRVGTAIFGEREAQG